MEAVSRSAEINVYGAYTPAEYERRGADGGGIADKDNYEVHTDALQRSDTAFTAGMRLYNNTKGNLKYQWSEGWDDDFITDIIESGHGYHWKRSEIYQMNLPRPFMEQGLDDFVDGYLTQKLDELLR